MKIARLVGRTPSSARVPLDPLLNLAANRPTRASTADEGVRPTRLSLIAAVLFHTCAFGAGTTAWEMNTYSDFLRGKFQGLSLSRDGRVMLAPKLETLFSSDQSAVWSVVRTAKGAFYAATGHRGKVYFVESPSKSALYWTAPQPEVFALAIDSAGVLYAGTSPDGKIFRIENGHAVEYFDPKAKYIWTLQFDSKGALFAGVEGGKVLRITATGKGAVWYETGQSHVVSLAFDAQGRLLAGTEPNGILYRIAEKDKAFVLYDASLPEIRSMVTTPDGSIYAAALGGSLANRGSGWTTPASASPGGVTAPIQVTSITVSEDSAQAGLDVKPKADAAKSAAQPATQVTSQISTAIDVSGVEKSAIYRIHPDNTVETLWSSKEENVYDILNVGDNLVFSTDSHGRIYRLSPDRKVTLLAQTNEGEAVRLLRDGSSVVAATSNLGKLYRLGDGWAAIGTYEAPVHDSGSVARWGHLQARMDSCGGCSVVFQTRSGNASRPDKTWSDWSSPVNGGVASPNARYIQWKAEFIGANGNSPVVDNVNIAYLPQNTPPVVKSIAVVTQAVATATSKTAAPQTPSQAAYSVTVTDTGDAPQASSAGTPSQTLNRATSQQISISWQAEDPDGDKLVYGVYFRGEGEREWKLLKANMQENVLVLDGDVLADGRYYFRVVASDRLVNPPSTARTGELIGIPVLIDNTPPLLTAGEPRRNGAGIELDVDAVDSASPLRRAEYSLDAGPWTPIEAADGLIDSQREKLLVRIDSFPAGEHLIVVRAYDAAGNAGLVKVVVR